MLQRVLDGRPHFVGALRFFEKIEIWTVIRVSWKQVGRGSSILGKSSGPERSRPLYDAEQLPRAPSVDSPRASVLYLLCGARNHIGGGDAAVPHVSSYNDEVLFRFGRHGSQGVLACLL